MNATLIKKYTILLKEASQTRANQLPEILLPAPKDQLRVEIEQLQEEQSLKLGLAEALNAFSTDLEAAVSLTVKIVIVPFILSFVYAIWIAIHGASWLWLAASFMFLVTASFSLISHFLGAKTGFVNILLVELASGLAFASLYATMVRLFVYSGIVGVYNSVVGRFSFFDLLLSLLSLVMGLYLMKSSNTLYYFLFTNKYNGLPKRITS